MRTRGSRFAAVLMAFVFCAGVAGSVEATALDDYVAKVDPFSTVGLGSTYSVVNTVVQPSYTAYVIDMTSQRWRDLSEVNVTDWQHYLTVYKPNSSPSGFSNISGLIIGGGSNGGGAPGIDGSLGGFAAATDSVLVELTTVPNQPLQFAGEAFTRSEDDIIAKTFREYLDGGDDEWPLLLPMVKSAVRAMDTVQDFLPTTGVGVGDVPQEFFVTGGSKRGWTTWLTAAADRRVSAIAPQVIDVLNMEESMLHHRQFYEGVTNGTTGGFSNAVSPYTNEGIFDEIGNPSMIPLLKIVDPFEYRDRLTMPKYIVNSTGDEFFVPDSAQFYFDDLLGDDNYLRYVPNTGHGLNSTATDNVATFYQAVLAGEELPEFSWELDGTNGIRVNTIDAPLEVNLWQATNPVENDFRDAYTSVTWTSSTLSDLGGGEFLGTVATPGSGATAFMIELVFDSPFADDYVFTTQVRVVPEVALLEGDVNGDGVVNGLDANVISQFFLQSGMGHTGGDLNDDGVTDGLDANIVSANFLAGSPSVLIPEPGGMCLAMLGLLGLTVGRRRR